MFKRISYIWAVVAIIASAVITSCSREETNSLVVPSHSILVAAPGDTGSTTFDSRNISSLVPVTIPKGWVVNSVDMYNSTITVTAPSSFDNEEVESGTMTLNGYTPTGDINTVSVYLAIVSDEVDYTDKHANCYIATEPDTRYIFDATRGGNGDIELNTERIELLWQTSSELIKYLDMRDGKVVFYLESAVTTDDEETDVVVPGNALIGAYDASGKLIWSWHIWVTNNDPTAADNTFEMAGYTVMNHNLGADTNSDGDTNDSAIFRSYGLYYQWGRMTPIVGPNDWNFAANYDKRLFDFNGLDLSLEYVESKVGGSIEWSIKNPVSMIIGNPDNAYDWLNSGHDDTLWSGTTKSDYDPCPAGWQLPANDLYANLTIAAVDDDMAWQEAQPMYGWNLVDTETNEEHFFSAAGRRNYLDGRLDNMNTNLELPVPWSGYYWTATTDGDDAKALYFNLNTNTRTWNGIDTEHKMHRANALPVRCVKVK